jgi:Transcription factor Tfb4
MIISQVDDVFMPEEGTEVKPRKYSTIATALMKAVCYSRGWIEEVTHHKTGGGSGSEQFSARILIIKSPFEDPSQHKAIVNSIFACQKLKINIDSVILNVLQQTASQ